MAGGAGEPRPAGRGRPGAAQLDGLDPGFWLAALLDQLDPTQLEGDAVVAYIGACERQAAWAQSRQLDAIRELAHRRPPAARCELAGPDERTSTATVSRFAADEVAAELCISRRGAENRIGLALALARLTATRSAFGRGRLDLAKVRAIEDATGPLGDEQAAVVEARVIARAPEQLLGGLRDSLAREAAAVDPAAAEKRHRRKVLERTVALVPLTDGMTGVWSVHRANDALRYYEGITALAEKAMGPGDTRTLDQRRADVVADIGAALLDRDDLPRRHGRRPHLLVMVSDRTLLGLDDLPGALAGYGPIPASMAREIAGDATWRRILTDPRSGTLTDYGDKVYRPPQALADKVIAKHQRCRGPGCRLPAGRCHIDHVEEFPRGRTAEPNLGPLCRHSHLLKHETHWSCAQEPDGTYVWTSPVGRVYRYPLEPILGDPRLEGAGVGRAGVGRAGVGRAGVGRAGVGRAGVEQVPDETRDVPPF